MDLKSIAVNKSLEEEIQKSSPLTAAHFEISTLAGLCDM